MKLLCKRSTASSTDKTFPKAIAGYLLFLRKKASEPVKLHIYRGKREESYPLTTSTIKKIHDKFKKNGKATLQLKDVTIMISEVTFSLTD